MKTDPLEAFIRNNRDQFDDREPVPHIWQQIQKAQPDVRFRKRKAIMLRVASLAAVFLLGYLFSLWLSDQAMQTESTQAQHISEPQVLQEARLYYTSLIDERKQQLFTLTAGDETLQNEIMAEFDQLEKAYATLEKDLADQMASEEVIEAMIQHHRIKLEMLEDILFQIKSARQTEEKEVRHVL